MTKKTAVPLTGRPCTMVARFLETMPGADERPIRDNAAIREEATRRILPAVAAVLPDVALDRLEAALQGATRWADNSNEIAAKLAHRLKKEATDELVAAVSSLSFEIGICHEMMVKTWVRARGIAPLFKVGDEVIATLHEGLFNIRSVHGTVAAIDPDLALYTVKTVEAGRRASYQVEFENVVRRGESLQQEPSASIAAGDED